MAKTFLFTLLCALLAACLLTGCEYMAPPPETTPPATIAPQEPTLVPTGLPSEDSASSGTLVDPVRDFGFTAFPEGNYLADPMFDTEEELENYDANLSFIQHGSSGFGGICVTDDAIYSCLNASHSRHPNHTGILMYTEKDSCVSMPLCGKPECTHTDTTCNAYLSQQALGLQIYNGKIYWLDSSSMMLMRMNLDGTNHEVVLDLGSAREIINGIWFNDPPWFIHRGYFYVSRMVDEVVDGSTQSSFMALAFSLDGEDSLEIMRTSQPGHASNCSLKPLGNSIYISFGFSDSSNDYFSLFRWDSKTRNAECLYTQGPGDNAASEIKFYDNGYPMPIRGDGLYFSDYTWGTETTTIMKISFTTGNLEKVGSFETPYQAIRFTKDHIVGFNEDHLLFYDRSGNCLFQSDPLDFNPGAMLAGEDDRYAYYFLLDGDIVAIPLHGGPVLSLA